MDHASPATTPPAARPFLLSVVIPVYNERHTVREILHRVRAVDLPLEIVVVDDGSTDGSREILAELAPIIDRLILHPCNRGKGAAIRTGLEAVTGDMVVVQDADLEYDPREYPMLIGPILEGQADVVYGSRFLGGRPHRVLLYWHSVANWALTTLSNMVTNLNLTDMETCFKVFRTDVLRQLDLRERGFGIEPEITAKVARMRCLVYEVGISYHGRGYDEGKKIGMKDALWALVCIFRYGWFSRRPAAPRGLRRPAEQTEADDSADACAAEANRAPFPPAREGDEPSRRAHARTAGGEGGDRSAPRAEGRPDLAVRSR